MKKEELPQDDSALKGLTRELCYVKDENGNYVTALSSGWQVKKDALDQAWEDINERTQRALEEVKAGRKKPDLLLHGTKRDGHFHPICLCRHEKVQS